MIQTAKTPLPENQPALESQYDVIVIGAGPAGAAAAAFVAMQNRSVLLLERETVPRFHVGESLLPCCYDHLDRMGVLEQMKQSAFPKKYSVQFVTEKGKITAPFYFDQYKPGEASQTWQVERSVFDKMLVDRAVELGTTLRVGAHVMDVLLDGEKASGVKVRLSNADGSSEIKEIASKVVIDASGQSTVIANRLGVKMKDDRLQKATIWTYYKDVYRDSGPRDEGATLIMQTEGKKSWFWFIPIDEEITSIGCTGSLNYMFRSGRGSAEDVFADELTRCPEMTRRLENAELVSKFHSTKDFSYRTGKTVGEGWVTIGDAFGFIDPVYSSGVLLALASGEFAAEAIAEAFEKNDFSEQILGQWQPSYEKGLDNFKRLVYAFYAPDFSFGQFFRKHPMYREHMTDILMGDVFRPEVAEIFDAMGEVIPPTDIEQEEMAMS